MRIDGIEITPGGEIQNLVVDFGSSFPNSPDTGEIFYRTDPGNIGMYVYNGTAWVRFTVITELANVAFTGVYSALSGTPVLAPVALTGSYTDLTNQPSLASVALTGSYSSLSNTPSLATVATSGSYTDLSNQPTIQQLNGLSFNQSLVISGDATAPATLLSSGSITLTLAPSGVSAATYGSTIAVPVITVDAKGRITSASNATITPANIGAVPASSLAVANGVATLDSTGKLLTAQIPASLVGAVVYQGTWNASTNVPTLTSSSGTKGWYYKVATAGTTALNGISQWNVGDTVIYDGASWDKIDGLASEVTSVAGRTGAVVLTPTDVSLSAVTNTKQLPYTQTLAITGDASAPATSLSTGTIALTLAASGVGAGTYNSSATQVSPFTVDAKGRVTAVGSAITITPAWGSITGKPTSLAGYGITDAVTFTGDATSAATTLSSDSIALTLASSGVTAGQYGSGTLVPVITVDSKGRLTSVTTSAVTTAGIGAVPTTQLGVANGVATLNASGQLTTAQIPSTLLGAIVYQGTWDANANSPTLASGTGTKGWYYVVATAGTTTIDGVSQWNLGDWIVFDGAKWDKLDGISSEVLSINGRVGAVSLSNSDVGLSNVTNVQQLPVTQTLLLAGDITAPSTALNTGTITATLAASGVSAGTYGSAAFLPVLTIDAKGRVTNASNLQITSTNIGALPNTLTVAHTGDVTSPATLLSSGTSVLTLVASGVTAGTYNNSATQTTPLTIDAKGRVTSTGTAVTLTPAWASVTGKPTTLAGYAITDTLAVTGDVLVSATALTSGSLAATLAASGVTAGTYGSTSTVPVLTIDAKGRTTVATTATITPAAIGAVANTALGATNGVATLNSSGQLTSSQIPSSLLGAVVYQGTWNASTNSPALASGTGTKGNYYVVSTAGTTTIDGVSTWYVGDWIVFDGTKWDKLDGIGGQVVSVNGRAGSVVLASTDVGLGNVTNVQQLPYTQTLAHTGDVTATATALNTGTIALTLAASGVSAGAYGSATTVPTITVDAKGRVTAASVNTITPAGIGALPSTQTLAMTGDVTAPSTNLSTGTIATTLAASGVTAGTYNSSATAITPMTFDSKGRITGTGTAVTLTPAWTSLTGVPATFTPPAATTSTIGGIIVGSGLNISTGTLSAAVLSVAGKTGNVTLTNTDVGLANVLNVQQLPATQTLAHTGDVTSPATALSAGTVALTLTATGVTSGTYNTATTITPLTIDAKGRVTNATTAVTITPAWTSITGVPATFTPPVATTSTLGGIIVGSGLSIAPAGTLSLPAATASTIGGIIAGAGITMTGSTASLTPATNSSIGGVIAGAGTVMSGSNITVAAATSTTIGGFIAGAGISMSGSTATVAPATTSVIGGLMVGNGLSITTAGLLSANVLSVAGRTGAVVLSNSDVGLGNVTNTQQLAYTQTLAATGDATAPATALNTGTIALTLASSGVTAGTYGDANGVAGTASTVPIFTVDAKGRITSATDVPLPYEDYIILGTATAVSGTTWTKLTGLGTPTLVSGATYAWEFVGAVKGNQTFIGVGLRLETTTGNGFSAIAGRWELPYLDTQGNSWSYSQNTETANYPSTNFSAANTNFTAVGKGTFTVGAGTSVTANVWMVSDSTSGTVTMAVGSYLYIRRIA